MTPLQQAIKKSKLQQYPNDIFDSDAEVSFFWQIKKTSTLPVPNHNVQLLSSHSFEFDFVWDKQKIVVEIDGGIWRKGGGAHSRPSNILRDMEKNNLATKAGYRLFRFTPDQVKNGEALDFIKELF